MTSRGCPFQCAFCHIASETEGSLSGNTRRLRQKSLERVMREMDTLKGLGVKHVFFEDDSLLAKRQRALSIFRSLKGFGLELSGVNGVNLAHLNRAAGKGNTLVVDEELFETIAEAGMKKLTFPFESGSQRLIDQFATKKLDLTRHNLSLLIRKAKSLGMEITGNYMVGYPGETYADIKATMALAKKHREEDGMDNANLAIITPFPGTPFYEMVVANDWFLPNVELADLDWMYPSIKTDIPPRFLVSIITKGWKALNDPKRVNRIRSMTPQGSPI
jgi:anaerobic magnesium-protoporphyrin IX monomethyl ester cyclase